MSKNRLDHALVARHMVSTRSQAESYIKMEQVKVNGQIVNKSGFLVRDDDNIELLTKQQYVSRAAFKLASVVKLLGVTFQGRTVFDIGSSTGGFTDYALQHGAKKVICVDVGSNQLHPSLRSEPRIELHEKTDIRDFLTDQVPDLILIDVSFISLREILAKVHKLASTQTQILAMVKPQFEAGHHEKHKGIIKNDRVRRQIFKALEDWIQNLFIILDKADSEITGEKGNRERFYLLKKTTPS